MAGSVNKVILLCRLGQDPTIRTTQDGKEIASLSVATSESWKDKSSGEYKDKTEWHKIVIYNEHLVKVAKNHLKKGSQVYIEGQLQTRKWTDKDKTEKYTTEIILQNYNGVLSLLDSKKDGEKSTNNSYPADKTQRQVPPNDVDDEIPF